MQVFSPQAFAVQMIERLDAEKNTYFQKELFLLAFITFMSLLCKFLIIQVVQLSTC